MLLDVIVEISGRKRCGETVFFTAFGNAESGPKTSGVEAKAALAM